MDLIGQLWPSISRYDVPTPGIFRRETREPEGGVNRQSFERRIQSASRGACPLSLCVPTYEEHEDVGPYEDDGDN
jgi:hypothetical protein